ncbi:MAG: ABC transporter permease subunit [Phycisphaerales bacterium]|nr:MAG: ABC transporter permease subunit [Phycisphaerales bacterium]
MSRGLIGKTLREVWVALLLFAAGIMAFEALFAYVWPQFYEDFVGTVLQFKLIQHIFKGLLGTEVGPGIGLTTFAGMAWVHPIVLALLWAQEMTFCTRVPAGEVDRGTVDLLLGLPVSRRQVFLCESAVWLLTGLILVCSGLLGSLLGGLAADKEMRQPIGRLLIVAINFYGLYVAVGGICWLVSSLSDHRGRAIAVVFALVLVSFLLNFLGQLWEPAQAVQFLGVLNYYRPVVILGDGVWPLADMLTLVTVGGVCWLIGGVVFARRDICTV